ncbi:MAG: tRNA guanosine(34) transglycosylase Tgt [Puniceicoccales bacterium]|jgi:queuine tRNA-ribosyltransferase|nr:tRNA guanosine(34) transglycosylase Tgt [Puniceicoccales bacterium]
MENFDFKKTKTLENSRAHCGLIKTPHGIIETPNFIFCATQGAIKGATMEHVRATEAQCILGNTYHLWLQPGPELIEKHGGLHHFMGWSGPMLTDSGGFQIFSLGYGGVIDEIKGKHTRNIRPKSLLKITEEGALFRSYTDGSRRWLTPEISILVQQKLGADFILPLDECTPFHMQREQTALSMEHSHRWEMRSLQQFSRTYEDRQRMYGIVQGGVYEDLRATSVDFVNGQPFFGQAIGGSLGGSREQMYDVVRMTMRRLAQDRPTHLLGIGGLRDILVGVESGIDTFDCVHPTRIARHGCALVSQPEDEKNREHINLKNKQYREDLNPIENDCDCYTCRNFTRAYIHHLFKAKEHTGGLLLTLHNVRFMVRWMLKIRQAIQNDTWVQFVKTHKK